MDFKELEYIVAIAEARSISRAAERFFVSQSALSQHLSKLEKDLGVTLFVRERHGLVPTAAGHAYINNARRILGIRDETYRLMETFAAKEERRILVGAAFGRNNVLFAKIYPAFAEKYPEYELSLQERTSEDAEHLLTQGKLDIALSFLMPEDLGSELPFRHECLLREKLLLIVPRHHPLVPSGYHATGADDCPAIDLGLFREERFILPSARTKLRHHINETFRSRGITPQLAFEVLNTTTVCSGVGLGNLCGVISSGFLIPDDSIAYFSIEGENTMEYSVCWSIGHRLSDAEQYFIRLCKENTES